MDPTYSVNCQGCLTSQGLSDTPGGIVSLPGGWIVNQYRAYQGFLGWLILQPRSHRDEIAELSSTELSALGGHLKSLDTVLRSYWRIAFPDDPIERVYFLYFFESPFDLPTPPPFHLHFHAVPRTKCLAAELREPNGAGSIINAWNVYKLRDGNQVPHRYLRPEAGEWTAASALLAYLRNELERPH
jgi:hypothetical protein